MERLTEKEKRGKTQGNLKKKGETKNQKMAIGGNKIDVGKVVRFLKFSCE